MELDDVAGFVHQRLQVLAIERLNDAILTTQLQEQRRLVSACPIRTMVMLYRL